MHILFHYPSQLLLTESPTVGFFYLCCLATGPYLFLSRLLWAFDWLLFLFLCMSICLVASSLFQRHVAFHFRLDGSGFELFQICVPLDAVGLGAGEQTVKDHYTVCVTLTRLVYMPLIILLSQDCRLDSCTLFFASTSIYIFEKNK